MPVMDSRDRADAAVAYAQSLTAGEKRRLRREGGARKSWRITDAFLEEVAEAYRREPSVDALRQQFAPAGHSTAARWLTLARRRGLLP